MNENVPDQIRFCDQYEKLLDEFMQALITWKQVRGPGSADTGKIELLLAERGYIGALAKLQVHSRECVPCEETLRVYVNVNDSGSWAATSNTS